MGHKSQKADEVPNCNEVDFWWKKATCSEEAT